MPKVTVYYRLDKLAERMTDGTIPYRASIELVSEDNEVVSAQELPRVSWPDIVKELAKLCHVKQPDAVFFQSTAHVAALPVELPTAQVRMFVKDPLAAMKALVEHPAKVFSDISAFYAARDFDPEVFGETLYTPLKEGKALCPLTGEWRQLAYGENSGWRIQGASDDWTQWLPIFPVSPDGARWHDVLMHASWAAVHCYALWGRDAYVVDGTSRYYFPRAWNTSEDGWIDKDDIKLMLELELEI